ncbi:MAG: hypothetical protein WBL45_07515 [Solirubrobacterales bacterium]
MLATTITIAREQRDGLYELVRRAGDQEALMQHVVTAFAFAGAAVSGATLL